MPFQRGKYRGLRGSDKNKDNVLCRPKSGLIFRREMLRGNTIRNQDKEERHTKASIQLSTHLAFKDNLPVFSPEPTKSPKINLCAQCKFVLSANFVSASNSSAA